MRRVTVVPVFSPVSMAETAIQPLGKIYNELVAQLTPAFDIIEIPSPRSRCLTGAHALTGVGYQDKQVLASCLAMMRISPWFVYLLALSVRFADDGDHQGGSEKSCSPWSAS